MRKLYIFLDEGGNFDFSATGSRYFTLSCVSAERPFTLHTELDTYKYDLIEYGLDTECFHCAYDNSHVRSRVFAILQRYLASLRIDSLIVEKCKTHPAMREAQAFYPRMLGYLLRYVVNAYDHSQIAEVVMITDQIPINKKRKVIEKSIKITLAKMLPDVRYRLLHHSSRAHYGLQIADYCNWAVFRKWEREDAEHYQSIRPALKSEFDIFESGIQKYY